MLETKLKTSASIYSPQYTINKRNIGESHKDEKDYNRRMCTFL